MKIGVGEAIEHICLKFLSRDLQRARKQSGSQRQWEPRLCERGETFIRGIAINFVAAVFQVMYILLCGHVQPQNSAVHVWSPVVLYPGVYTVLTLDQQCWPFKLQSCIIALLVVCGWWPFGYTNVCPFVDKWMSVHVLYVMGCCHREGAEHHHTNSGPNYLLL